MEEIENYLHSLYQMMEEEIADYHLLIRELEQESKYLRQNTLEALMKSVQTIEIQTNEILKMNESIQQTIEKILIDLGEKEREKTLSSLIVVLPSLEHQKIKFYQGTLKRLKEWVAQVNARNKSFIQESLKCWKDLFSMLTHSTMEWPVYVQNGGEKIPTPPPYSLNQKV